MSCFLPNYDKGEEKCLLPQFVAQMMMLKRVSGPRQTVFAWAVSLSLLGLSDGEDSQRAVTTFLRLKTKSADDNENNEANRDNEAKWEWMSDGR